MKKVFALFATICIMIIGLVTPTFAVNQDFSFYVTSGGSSDYSYATKKSDDQNAWYVTPKTTSPSYPSQYSNWVNGETMRFRVRFDADRSDASGLYSRTNPNYGTSFSYGYYDSTPTYNIKYRLYADKPASDPYSAARLVGTWCP